jgi:hypothetical protein
MHPDRKKVISVLIMALAAMLCIIGPCTAGINIRASHGCVLAKGDPLTLTGDGYHNGSAAIWGTGHSFFTHEIIPADSDGVITWTWNEKVTEKFHSGPFTILVQDPGQDRVYSVVANAAAGTFLAPADDSASVLTADGVPPDIPAALDLADFVKNQIAGSGTDDSCLLKTVYVEEPALHLSTGETGRTWVIPSGGCMVLQGTMNMAAENRIGVRIHNTSVIERTGDTVRPVAFALTGRGQWENTWEYFLDTTGLSPGEYLVGIGWDKSAISGQNAFILVVTGGENWMDKMRKEFFRRIPISLQR